MSDPDRIYLQPECCAGSEGRLWCEDPEPVDCENGRPWTEYVRAGLYDKMEKKYIKRILDHAELLRRFRRLEDENERLRTKLRAITVPEEAHKMLAENERMRAYAQSVIDRQRNRVPMMEYFSILNNIAHGCPKPPIEEQQHEAHPPPPTDDDDGEGE